MTCRVTTRKGGESDGDAHRQRDEVSEQRAGHGVAEAVDSRGVREESCESSGEDQSAREHGSQNGLEGGFTLRRGERAGNEIFPLDGTRRLS